MPAASQPTAGADPLWHDGASWRLPPKESPVRGPNGLEMAESHLRVLQTRGLIRDVAAFHPAEALAGRFELVLPDASVCQVAAAVFSTWIDGYSAAWGARPPALALPGIAVPDGIGEEPLTVAEAAELLGIGRNTLQNRIRRGQAPGAHAAGEPHSPARSRWGTAQPRRVWVDYGMRVGRLAADGATCYPRLVAAALAGTGER